MTIPHGVKQVVGTLADFVRDLIPKMRYRMSPQESRLAIHLRGNKELYEALTDLIHLRLSGRAGVVEPADPVQCKANLARDGECRWLLAEIDHVYRAPVNQAVEEDEPPAA